MTAAARQSIIDALDLSASVIRDGVEVVPRYSAVTLTGRVTIFVQLPDDGALRRQAHEIVADMMALKGATQIVVSAELRQPDAVFAAHAAADGVLAALCLVTRSDPPEIGPVQWLTAEQIGDELAGLLPSGAPVSAQRQQRLEALIAGQDIDAGDVALHLEHEGGRWRLTVIDGPPPVAV